MLLTIWLKADREKGGYQMDNRQKAMNILRALSNSTVTASWLDLGDGLNILSIIETTLNRLEQKEKAPAETAISEAGAFQINQIQDSTKLDACQDVNKLLGQVISLARHITMTTKHDVFVGYSGHVDKFDVSYHRDGYVYGECGQYATGIAGMYVTVDNCIMALNTLRSLYNGER